MPPKDAKGMANSVDWLDPDQTAPQGRSRMSTLFVAQDFLSENLGKLW